MSDRLSKKGERLVKEFERKLAESSLESSEGKAAALEEYRTALYQKHAAPPLRFIKLEEFVAFGGFPRCPDNKNMTIELDKIDRNNSLMVFISHCWLRGHPNSEGWDGSPHPDNAAGDKYRLCCEKIEELRRVYAPRVKDCYVWMDFCCMNQDSKNDLSEELEHYDRIVEVCDCVFTPIANSDKAAWDFGNKDLNKRFVCAGWNQGPGAYLNRAWCRVEMLYAAMIPVLENDNNNSSDEGSKRHTMFEAGLAYHCSQNRRPHLLSDCAFGSIILPPLQNSFLMEYNPLEGHLTNPSDIHYIRQLLSDLQPYIDSRRISVGYCGDTNEYGQPHGRGVMVYEDGITYDGQWKNGQRCGFGVGIASNGEKYVGNWENDRRNGQGIFYYPDDSVYEGQWVEGAPNGYGVRRYTNGDVYEGEWNSFDKCGHGIYVYADGSKYNGEWKEDKKCGHGVYTFVSGATYDGDWLNDVRHGHGSCRYADGDEYNGEWKEDKSCGHGVYTFADGAVYEGEWLNGLRHGHGSWRYADGDEYNGEWKEDNRCGHGVYTFADGAVYEGEWLNDVRL